MRRQSDRIRGNRANRLNITSRGAHAKLPAFWPSSILPPASMLRRIVGLSGAYWILAVDKKVIQVRGTRPAGEVVCYRNSHARLAWADVHGMGCAGPKRPSAKAGR